MPTTLLLVPRSFAEPRRGADGKVAHGVFAEDWNDEHSARHPTGSRFSDLADPRLSVKLAGDLVEPGSLRPHLIFIFFHRIQRAKALTVGHAGCVQLSRPDTMTKSSVRPNAPVALPPLVAVYVEATNTFDLERLMATFAEDALVNDQLRDY
jgi:hypothetical protein